LSLGLGGTMMKRVMLKWILPLACSWAQKQETISLRNGVILTEPQLADARRVGIVHPERVRLLFVKEIPLPVFPMLRRAAESTGLISRDTLGMTLRYGIFIRADYRDDRLLLVHELAHTAQYERFGGFTPFLKEYLRECLTPPGYPFGPLEQEALRVGHAIVGESLRACW
jgi:hypothetical protein